MNYRTENIRTPDQKLRVFVSSTLRELADERNAVRSAIESLHMTPVMFELGARPHPPKDLYQAYLRQSDIFVGIYWQSYGWIAENETISGLEDEYRLSGAFPRLIYVKEPAPAREDKLKTMLDDIRSNAGVSYKSFKNAEELARFLTEDLAIMLSERFYSVETQVQAEPERPHVHSNLPTHLPAVIGRQEDIEKICRMITEENSHLITVSGPGGIGKTMLALAVADSLSERFEDGVYFIDLSEIKEDRLVLSEISSSLGIHVSKSEDALENIAGFISFQKILIVLDNFEQLASSSKAIASLNRMCPNLVILITSRSILNISAEKIYLLKSLGVPSVTDDFDAIAESPSVKVFMNKATGADPKFELTEENSGCVAEICRMLEGIPLAIGLAAVKVRAFSPKVILQKLTGKLSALSGGSADAPERHKTMRAAIEWSYELLDESERKMFVRLAVFAEGFDLEAAEDVCGEGIDDTGEVIESLVTKNLIRKLGDVDGVPRYKMAALIREYAKEQFESGGEMNAVKLRHADFYLRKSLEDDAKFSAVHKGSGSARWDLDAANVIGAAETFMKAGKYPELVSLLYSLWQLFWIFDYEPDLVEKVNIYDVMTEAKDLDEEERGKLVWLAGASALSKGDIPAAEHMFAQAGHYLKDTDNKSGRAWASHLITSIRAAELKKEDYDDVIRSFENSLKVFREIGDYWGESGVIQNMAALETSLKHYSKATKLYDEFERLSLASGSTAQLAHIKIMRGWISFMQKDDAKAEQFFREGMEFYKDSNSTESVCYALIVISQYLFKKGNDAGAMYMAGLLDNIISKYHFTPWQMLAPLTESLRKIVEKKKRSPEYSEYEKACRVGVYKGIRRAYDIIHESA